MVIRRISFRATPLDTAGESVTANERRFRAAVERAFEAADINFSKVGDAAPGTATLYYRVDGTGAVEADANAMDYTGQIGAQGQCAVIDATEDAYFIHDGSIYVYVGVRPVSIGAACPDTATAADFVSQGGAEVEWDDIVGVPSTFPPEPHTHLEASITDLDKYSQADVDAKDAAVQANLTAHIGDNANPHNTSWDDLVGPPPDVVPHTHVEADITDLDKYSQADVDAKDAAVQANLTTHEADTDNPHGTSWDNLTGLQPPPLSHTHVEADITDLDKYSQADVDAKDAIVQGNLTAHEGDTNNPHGTSWGNLVGIQPPPLTHTHVEANITDLDKYSQAEIDALLSALQAYTEGHVNSTSNPHGVTAAQAGAVPVSQLQATAAQTTGNAVLRMFGSIGPFGLGGVSGLTISDLDDLSTPNGFYRTINQDGTFPDGASSFGSVIKVHYDGDDLWELYSGVTRDDLFFRRTRSGTVQEWQQAALYDPLLSAGYVPLEGGTLLGRLILNADPSGGLDAATKQYVDAQAGSGTTVFTGLDDTPSTFVGQAGLAVAVNAGETGLEFVSIAAGDYLLRSGGTMLGEITLSGTPTNVLHATPKGYVDDADTALGLNIEAHKADEGNPHNTTWEDLSGIQPPPLSHTHVEADITDLDKYSQADVDAKDAIVQGNLTAHEGDTNNPHGTSWSNLSGAQPPPIAHTHTEANITDLDKYSQADVDAKDAATLATVADEYLPRTGGEVTGAVVSLSGGGGFQWKAGAHRITNNDGGGNANIRMGNRYQSQVGVVATQDNGGGVQLFGSVDNRRGEFSIRLYDQAALDSVQAVLRTFVFSEDTSGVNDVMTVSDGDARYVSLSGVLERDFATRAAFVAYVNSGNSHPDGTLITVSGTGDGGTPITFVAKASANPFPDLIGYVPEGTAQLYHWGVVGIEKGNTLWPPDMPIPTVDESGTIQVAMTWCLLNGKDLRGDNSRCYGAASSITWGATWNGQEAQFPAGEGPVATLHSCMFAPTSGSTWTYGDVSDPDPKNWTFGAALLYVGKKHNGSAKVRVSTKGITVFGGDHKVPGGIQYRGTARSYHSGNIAFWCKEYQQQVGHEARNNNSCTDTLFHEIGGNEWTYDFGELSWYDSWYAPNTGQPYDPPADPNYPTGFTDLRKRSSVGLVVDGSDSLFTDCAFQTCKHALVIKSANNCQIKGGMFWNGQVRDWSEEVDGIESVSVWVSPSASRYNFTGCRFDDGQVRIYNFLGGFVGCMFIQFTDKQMVNLVATAPGETASDFVFVGNLIYHDQNNNLNADLVSEGGSWGSFKGMVSANQTNDGTPFSIGGVVTRLSTNAFVSDADTLTLGGGSLTQVAGLFFDNTDTTPSTQIYPDGDGSLLFRPNGATEARITPNNAGLADLDTVVTRKKGDERYVLFARLDALEQLMVTKGLVTQQEIDALTP